MNYNLLVFGYSSEYLPLFKELNVCQLAPFWKNERDILRFLLRTEFSRDPIRLLPGTEIFPELQTQPVCALFFRDWLPIVKSGFLKKMRERLPAFKACWFFSDLVSTYPNINPEDLKKEFDLLLSFDPEDAKHYGLLHCPLPYSKPSQLNTSIPAHHDVSFIGQAKGRLDLIFSVYETLKQAGFRTDFHIANTPLPLRQFSNEINYCSFTPYKECLEKTLSSRCILELLQDPDHHGYTARTAEALVFGRKLISNNIRLQDAPFYDPGQIHLFTRPEEINPAFIQDEAPIQAHPLLFSPRRTLECIGERLNICFSPF